MTTKRPKWTGVTKAKWQVMHMEALAFTPWRDDPLTLSVHFTPTGRTPWFWQVTRNGFAHGCDHAPTRAQAILAAERVVRRLVKAGPAVTLAKGGGQ